MNTSSSAQAGRWRLVLRLILGLALITAAILVAIALTVLPALGH